MKYLLFILLLGPGVARCQDPETDALLEAARRAFIESVTPKNTRPTTSRPIVVVPGTPIFSPPTVPNYYWTESGKLRVLPPGASLIIIEDGRK